MGIELKAKKWGNSIGIIIPSEIVTKLNLKPESKVLVEIEGKKENVLKEMFGATNSKKSASKIIKKFREDFVESKWI